MTAEQRTILLHLMRQNAEIREEIRRRISASVSANVSAWLDEERRDCPGCARWLPADEFRRGRGRCDNCEAERLRKYRAAKRAA